MIRAKATSKIESVGQRNQEGSEWSSEHYDRVNGIIKRAPVVNGCPFLAPINQNKKKKGKTDFAAVAPKRSVGEPLVYLAYPR